MKLFLTCVLTLTAAVAQAGDLWEFTSQSADPDGKVLPHAERKCLPSGTAADPVKLLDGVGACRYTHKTGTANALAFSMDCTTPGMPANLGGMKVEGDAQLGASTFDMRYTITVGNSGAPGGDFKMTGTLEGRKVGSCN